MTSWIPNVRFVVQILLAEMIFLYPAEKRRLFALRLTAAYAGCVVLAVLIPNNGRSEDLALEFFHFILLFLICTAAMGCCFRMGISELISCASAGYAVQHIAVHVTTIGRYYHLMPDIQAVNDPSNQLLQMLPFFIVYFLFWVTVGRYSAGERCYKKADMRFNYISISIVFICVGLTRAARYYGDNNSVTVSLYAIVSLMMALMVQLVLSRAVELQHDGEVMSLIRQKERQQYERTKKSIETINIKYHDLKHRLDDMHLSAEETRMIREAVNIYGSRVQTGSEVLDTLLSENMLRLNDEGISLTYTGNGGDFDFMSVSDVYSLFGNAIDNAVEAVRKLPDPEKKFINIVSERKGSLVTVQVNNYFTGDLTFDDGLPVTTAQEDRDFHGFGMRSMKLIAEKYDGELHAETDGDLFALTVYMLQK